MKRTLIANLIALGIATSAFAQTPTATPFPPDIQAKLDEATRIRQKADAFDQLPSATVAQTSTTTTSAPSSTVSSAPQVTVNPPSNPAVPAATPAFDYQKHLAELIAHRLDTEAKVKANTDKDGKLILNPVTAQMIIDGALPDEHDGTFRMPNMTTAQGIKRSEFERVVIAGDPRFKKRSPK